MAAMRKTVIQKHNGLALFIKVKAKLQKWVLFMKTSTFTHKKMMYTPTNTDTHAHTQSYTQSHKKQATFTQTLRERDLPITLHSYLK